MFQNCDFPCLTWPDSSSPWFSRVVHHFRVIGHRRVNLCEENVILHTTGEADFSVAIGLRFPWHGAVAVADARYGLAFGCAEPPGSVCGGAEHGFGGLAGAPGEIGFESAAGAETFDIALWPG